MKYLLGFFSVLMLISVNQIYDNLLAEAKCSYPYEQPCTAPPSFPGELNRNPLDIWNEHDLIIDGTVISSMPHKTHPVTLQYDIKVNEFFKPRDKSLELINAIADNTSTYFEAGSRVLFYLDKIEGTYKVSIYSVPVEGSCDARSYIQISPILPNDDSFVRGAPILPWDWKDPCIPTYFTYDPDFWNYMEYKPPLRQYKDHNLPVHVQRCGNDEHVSIISQSSPYHITCVKPETKQKLIERGWTIEVKPEPEPADKNDFAINEENKVDLTNPKIPRDKDGRIDYDELVKLVSKPYFSKLLTEQNVEHDPEDIVLMIGPRILMYTEYSSTCGYVIADDGEDYWLKSFLDYDTLTEAKIMDENPDPCKPNYGSCFCDAQIHKAENTMKELSYLTASEEQTIGKIVKKYLNNTKIANVPDKFVVGKYNFESKPDETTYCGQFIWNAHNIYFEGYIKNTNVVGFGLAFEKPKLCAINDNAQVFYFDKSSIQYD